VELTEYEKELSVLREKMSPSEFEAAWEEGQKMTVDEAILLATQAD
jgi:hypothetical protein